MAVALRRRHYVNSSPEVESEIAFDIDTLVNECRPESILIVGEDTLGCTQNFVRQCELVGKKCALTQISAAAALEQLNIQSRFDMGIVINAIENLEKETGEQLIARLRDVSTARFLVALPIGDQWEDTTSTWYSNELLGFGMKLVNRYDHDGKPVHIYKYDITSYKNSPKWLNSRDWANPHLWNKYRW